MSIYDIGKIPNYDLTIEEVTEYEYVRLTTGADFDFESGQDSDNLAFYGNLNGFFPDQFEENLGIMFNIFSNRFIGLDTLRSSETLYLRNGNLPGDSTAFKRIGLRSTEKIRTRNYGLNIGGLWKFADKGNSTLFFSLQIEGAITKYLGTYSYDTLGITYDSTSMADFNRLAESNKLITASRATVFTPSITLSIPYRYLSDEIEARVFLGVSMTRGFDTASNKYNIQFSPNMDINVLDRKFGVTIGGNLKYDYFSRSPVINIYIAKTFRFSQLAKF